MISDVDPIATAVEAKDTGLTTSFFRTLLNLNAYSCVLLGVTFSLTSSFAFNVCWVSRTTCADTFLATAVRFSFSTSNE